MVLHDKTKNNILERARRHIFSTGMGDAASQLSQVNMAYGLAKIHLVQEKYGLDPDASFVTTPDETISRNASRWEQGISYGGRLSWGSGKEKLTILDVKPNACGMLVGTLDNLPDPKDVVRSAASLQERSHYANNIKIEWDFFKGNHFIDVFKTNSTEKGLKLPPYSVIMHAGCSELKGCTEYGPGLYWNESKHWWEVCKKINTPFGYIYVLEGNDAKEYYDFFLKADKFAKKRREIAFKEIFDGKVMINETHQGLLNMNEIVLGCQVIQSKKQLFPISIRADLPSYLFRGKKNFTKQHIEDLGWTERAQKLGLTNRLRNSNILPHGGGYCFPDSLGVTNVFEVNKKRYFEIDMINSVGKKIVSNVRELQFSYRSRGVILKTLAVGLGEIAANLDPVYTIKF